VQLADVARAASVSVSAASVALNGRPGVSDATRARVVAVARKLGYVVDASASAMRSGRTRTVGFVADDPAHPLLADLAAAAAAAGLLVVVATPGQLGLLEARGVDGLVVAGSDRAATAWARSGRPLVVLGPGRVPRGAARVAEDEGAPAAAVVAALTAAR
jgi:DNA-binding LacI/PurR family transcriptional regulator